MIDEKTYSKLQEKLNDLLKEFSNSEYGLWEENKDLDEYFIQFTDIYGTGFRHQYHKFFEVVNSIFEDDDKDVSIFQENLKLFRRFVINKKDENFLTIFDKLYDHILLEISRREISLKQENEMGNMQKNYDIISTQAKNLEDKISNTTERLSKLHTDFVAILAIFAAVVVTFSSGSNYVLSSISAVNQSFSKELVFIVLICGLILMNTIFMLIYFIGRILERSLGIKWWLAIIINLIILCTLLYLYSQ